MYRSMFGCAAMIAVVAFVVGFVGGLITRDPNMPLLAWSLITGAMTAVMAFVASVALFLRDHSEQTGTVLLVRNRLMARSDVDRDEFCRSFPEFDATLMSDIRDAIGKMFEVPSTKIHPADELQRDFEFAKLEPGFHMSVVHYVLGRRVHQAGQFVFQTDEKMKKLGDLAAEIENVIRQLG